MAARFGHKRACLHFYVFVRFCVCLCCQPAPVLQLSIEFKKGVPTKVTLEDGTVETDPVKMWVVCLRRLLRLVVASVAVLAADQRPLLPGAPPSVPQSHTLSALAVLPHLPCWYDSAPRNTSFTNVYALACVHA